MTPFVLTYLILNILVLLLCIQPLLWQLLHHNLASTSHIFFIILLLTLNVLNVLLWPQPLTLSSNHGLILCDIELPLLLLAKYGFYGSTAAMLRNLARILDADEIELARSRKGKVMAQVVDGVLCFGIPTLVAGAHYAVQSARYMLYPVVGCVVSVSWNWVSVVVMDAPLWVFNAIMAYYAVLTLTRVLKYHRTISVLLLTSPTASTTSTTSRTRYYRLLSLSLLTAAIIVPSSIASSIYAFNFSSLAPYSLDVVRASFGVVAVYWGDAPTRGGIFVAVAEGDGSGEGGGWIVNPTYTRLSYTVYGLLIVLLLGCGKDAGRMYKRWFDFLTQPLRFLPRPFSFLRIRRNARGRVRSGGEGGEHESRNDSGELSSMTMTMSMMRKGRARGGSAISWDRMTGSTLWSDGVAVLRGSVGWMGRVIWSGRGSRRRKGREGEGEGKGVKEEAGIVVETRKVGV